MKEGPEGNLVERLKERSDGSPAITPDMKGRPSTVIGTFARMSGYWWRWSSRILRDNFIAPCMVVKEIKDFF